MKLFATPLTSSIALTISILTFSAHADTKAPVRISVSPLDKTHIKLEYRLPQSCKSLALYSAYGERTHDLRKEWLPLDQCGHLNDKDVLEIQADCNLASFSVPIQAKVIDRVNPVAYPFDEQGVLTHTATFIAEGTCGEVDWHFSSPKGAVIIDGVNRGSSTTLSQKDNNFITYTGVFLSSTPRAKQTPLIATNATPAWLKKGISDGAEQITAYYKKTYPTLNFLTPTLFISNTVEPNSIGMQADVSSRRMIRFGYFNAGDEPSDEKIKGAMDVTAHEFAHILQPNKQSSAYQQEGGPEFIRWMTAYKLGWKQKQELSEEFSNALANCLEIADNKSFPRVEKESLQLGYGIYTCGLAIHIIGLASRQTTESAEETISAYYQQWRAHYEQEFSQSLECGNLKNCTSRWLKETLQGDKPFVQQVGIQLSRLEIVKRLSAGKNPIAASRKAFDSLMKEDCGGSSFWSNENNFYVNQIPPTCKSFTNGLSISQVEGVSYFSEPLKALEAQNKGCRSKQSVTLVTLDNKSIKVACNREVIPSQNYYEIDADKLFLLLDKR
ncbi:MAG: hypothetical protein EOO53_04250 [Gammaproteobacteria bacterium]|nr:MAG: hypothetical protein EOO53_04250 [Gammaproteobacteria bacterium]